MLYVSLSCSPDFEKAIKEVLVNDEKFTEYRKQMANGFGISLDVTRKQIIAVFQREGVIDLDVAFSIYVDMNNYATEVFVFLYDDLSDKPTAFFPLLMKNGIEIPFNKWRIMPKDHPSLDTGYYDGITAGGILAADFGREGLPAEAKKSVAELARIFRKSSKPSNCPYFRWIGME